MRRHRIATTLALCLPVLFGANALAQTEAQDAARRHMVRGIAAVEIAANETDLKAAAAEFRKATEIDPTLAGAWYNLGTVEAKLGRFADSVAAYRRYVELSPGAEDAPKVRDEIIKLEYRLERAQVVQSLAGTWFGEGVGFALTMNGNEFRLQSIGRVPFSQRTITPYFKDMFGMLNDRLPKAEANVLYSGRIEGDRIRGERIRASYTEEKSGCLVPEQRSAVEGRLEEGGNGLSLSFDEPHYRAHWTGVFFGLEWCDSITPDTNVHQEMRFFRQVAPPAASSGK